ncbi:MAG: class I SAM-dependent methyltransferase, partial [Planctomycetota bacterium]
MEVRTEIYDHPEIYEIAFSFRDLPAEVDVFEECFRRFSKIPVRSVLELGCGNTPHMEELHLRGYRYSGLDLNEAMLSYSRKKAGKLGAVVDLLHGDMNDFTLPKPVDFVYILLGSLFVRTPEELEAHFRSVASALSPGGLYLLDWCIQFEPQWAYG